MSLIDGLAQLVDNNGDGLLSLNIGGRSVNGDNFHANGLSRRSPLPGADHGPDVPPILLRRESISSLHESLIVARSAVGDHGEMLQVPQSEIQNVLDKLKALEDEVSALLDNDGQDEDATAPEDTEPPNVASKVSDGHPAPEADNDEDPAQEDSSAKKEPPAKEHDSKDYSDEDAEAVDPDPAKEKPQSLPLGAGMFKEKEEKETDVYTSTMTRTRTTTVTVKPTMEAPESSAAPAASEATTAYRDSKAKIGGFNGAQSKEKVAQQPESATRVEPSVEPSASNATAIRRLPVAGTSTTPRSFPGHIAAGPPTFAPVPEGTGPQKFNNKAAPAAGETPISFPGHMVSGPLKFNNKAVFTNTSSSTGFRTVTVPGDSDA